MNIQLDLNLVSYLARKTRKALRKKIKEVSYGSVSAGTASHIETREKTVTEKKVYAYLENLGIPKEEANQHLAKIHEEIEQVQFSLDLINTMLDSNLLEKGITELQKIRLESYHPLYAVTKFLQGRYFRQKNDWDNAISTYRYAIKIYKKNNYDLNPNFLPQTYNSLSICYFYLDDLVKAINCVEKGLSYFEHNRKSGTIYYTLMRNQILYLERTNNNVQAFELTNKIWPEINKIEKVKVKLGFYKSRGTLLYRAKQHEDAIQCVKEGIRIARVNNELNRFFDLLNILGAIYMELEQYEESEECFKNVVSYKGYLNKQVDALINLGVLYSQLEKWQLASTNLDNALEICENSQIDIYRKSKVLIAQGDLYHSIDDDIKALSFYDNVIQLSKDRDLLRVQYIAAFRSLDCLLNLGRENEFSQRNKELFFVQKKLSKKERSIIHEILYG